jgi:cell division protein FtsL
MLPVSDFRVVKKEQSYNLIGRIRVRLLVALTVLVVGLFFTQLVFANSLATDGQKLAQIQSAITSLQAQNMTLKVQIAEVSSFQTLSKKAHELGFVSPEKLIVLK